MLKRLLTAVILIPLVVWAILGLPTPAFAIATGVFLALSAWEWSGLIPLRMRAAKIFYLILFMFMAGSAWWVIDQQPARLVWVLPLVMLWWVVAALWLQRPQLGRHWTKLKMLLPALVLLPVWLVLISLHKQPEHGPMLALFVFVLMWVADSGAYFAGRTFGKHKLLPQVSPGKTWEGAIGGLLVGGLLALGVAWWFGWTGGRLLGFVTLAVLCVLVSIVGDLFISLLKRQQGLKDTGTLFPGHGGVLDRIDSLLAAGPVFVYGLSWLDV